MSSMTTPLVFCLPGLTGSNLDRAPTAILPQLRYWYDLRTLALGTMRLLRLAADGVTPYYSVTGSIIAPSLAPSGMYTLVGSLQAAGFDARPLPYDWRLPLDVTAARLFPVIQSIAGDQPYYLVGFSMGGLVARYIWQLAGVGGTQDQIGRIVTIGTPHWGSYAAVNLYSYLGKEYAALAAVTAPSSAVNAVTLDQSVGASLSADLDFSAGSWPGLASLLPNLAEPGGPVDAYRAMVYELASYTSFSDRLPGTTLAAAITATRNLADPSSQPPDGVIVCVAGSGVPTIAALTRPGPLNRSASYGTTDGDGQVTRNSAILNTGNVTVYGPHPTLTAQPQVLDGLPGWLLDGLDPVITTLKVTGVFQLPGPTGTPEDGLPLKPQVFRPPATILSTDGSLRPAIASTPEPLPPYCQVGPRGP